MYRFSCLIRTT